MPNIPKTLRSALLDKYVVPFAGAGVSRAVLDCSSEPLFPGWRELLERAAARLREDEKTHEASIVQGLIYKKHPDFLAAASYAREGLGPVWYQLLKETFAIAFDRANPESLALARALWKLPSNLVVTTNYDHVLRWAHDKRSDLVELRIDASAELASMLRMGVERPTVWHLHGHIDDARNLILTPDGYRTLYPEGENQEVRYQSALESLRHLLAARIFLFVGFSLEDEQFGDQIEWVNKAFSGAAGPHYLLVRGRDLKDTQRRLERLTNIECLEFEDFGAPLVQCIEDLALAGRANVRPDTEPAARIRVSNPVQSTVSPPLPVGGAQDPLTDLRCSYRTIYSYHRNVFNRIEQLSDALRELGLEFERWDPIYYSRPARSSSEFFRRDHWAWDFLPGFALSLSWQSKSGSSTGSARRVALEIETDSGFKTGPDFEPNPKYFEPADASRSEFKFWLVRPTGPLDDWTDLWKLISQDPNIYDGLDHKTEFANGELTYRYFGVPISQVLESVAFEQVIAQIKAWFEHP